MSRVQALHKEMSEMIKVADLKNEARKVARVALLTCMSCKGRAGSCRDRRVSPWKSLTGALEGCRSSLRGFTRMVVLLDEVKVKS